MLRRSLLGLQTLRLLHFHDLQHSIPSHRERQSTFVLDMSPRTDIRSLPSVVKSDALASETFSECISILIAYKLHV